MSDKDGGSAFPTHMLNVPFDEADDEKHNGMTLRDYFAAKAMATLLDHSALTSYAEVAADAYMVADEMLKARAHK